MKVYSNDEKHPIVYFCCAKLKEKHVPRLAGTEGEIRNRWILVNV